MRKAMALILAMILFLLPVSGLCGAAEGEWADYVCKEQQFATKIPLSGTSGYQEGEGLMIYTETPGAIPYVIVNRRPMDMKFKDPVNFLNNVFREYMEEKYGDRFLGMNPARDWEIGGKTLLGARYMFKAGDSTVVVLRLIEIRDAGDVEYTVKFEEGRDETAMAAANEAVRNYTETDGTAQPEGKENPESGKAVLEPMSLAGMAVDRENGVYRVRIPDGEKVDDGGFFTAELYVADTYPLDSVYALQAGDRVLVAGSVWTVDSLLEEQDGRRELRVREDMDGYIVFEKETDTLCTALVNDWKPSTLLGTEKVMLPLPDKFTFAWLGPDEDSSRYYDQEAFVALLRSGETAGQLTQYNTSLRFSGGMVDLIVHSDYPEGPEETAQAPTPGDTGSSGTSSADAPAILAPAAFTSGFNTAMNLLAEEFTDVLGEDGAKEIRDSYLLSQTDPVGNFIYKGNGDWTLEAGFVFADESSALDNAPAVAASLTIRNAVPATTAYLARYALEMMISYEFRGEVSEDELRNWFDTAEDPGNVFTLPGYTLNVMKNDELVQYSILPPADRNPLLNGIQP